MINNLWNITDGKTRAVILYLRSLKYHPRYLGWDKRGEVLKMRSFDALIDEIIMMNPNLILEKIGYVNDKKDPKIFDWLENRYR